MDQFDHLFKELAAKSDVARDELLRKVNNKYDEMESLITKEGAVRLIAKELGINLAGEYRMKIREISLGMKNVSISGRIFKISKINEFQRDGRKGRVSNIHIGDSTGVVRIPLWDDQVRIVEDGLVTIGDVVKIGNGLVKENIYGEKEIALGKFGSINHVHDLDLPTIEELESILYNPLPERASIASLASSGAFEIRGTIVQLFKGNFMFSTCSICEGKLDAGKCNEHGEVPPNHALIVSFIVDDGTGDIRCVLFREVAEKLCEITPADLIDLGTDQRLDMMKEKLLGREMLFRGRVKRNKMFDRLEFSVTDFEDINALEESKRLVNEIEIIVGG
ncbi:MAG: hypothetical protein HYT70_00775 [Candidatus Aenigmarchaeota archaeon]|nr:hypothetical protein [Candidatus Aenigmarchaeota archaeon]